MDGIEAEAVISQPPMGSLQSVPLQLSGSTLTPRASAHTQNSELDADVQR